MFTNDHPPAHVHAVGPDCTAKFELNCPEGPVRLLEQDGFTRAVLSEIGEAIADRLSDCCAAWEEIHGQI